MQSIVYFPFCFLLGTSTSTTPFELRYFRLKLILGCVSVFVVVLSGFAVQCPSGLARLTILTHFLIRDGSRVESFRTPAHSQCPSMVFPGTCCTTKPGSSLSFFLSHNLSAFTSRMVVPHHTKCAMCVCVCVCLCAKQNASSSTTPLTHNYPTYHTTHRHHHGQ